MNIYVKLQINYLTLKIKICLKKFKYKFVKHLYIHHQIIVTVSLQKNSYSFTSLKKFYILMQSIIHMIYNVLTVRRTEGFILIR